MPQRSRIPALPLPAATEEITSLGFVRPPVDACEEAAQRLNVVIRLLSHHDCPYRPAEPDERDDDEGGYDMAIIRSAVRDIRDMLQASVRAAEAEQAGRKGGV